MLDTCSDQPVTEKWLELDAFDASVYFLYLCLYIHVIPSVCLWALGHLVQAQGHTHIVSLLGRRTLATLLLGRTCLQTLLHSHTVLSPDNF